MTVKRYLKEFAAVQKRRGPWENQWELVARYMLQRKQGFNSRVSPGEFYSAEDIYDNTAGNALQVAVSSLDGQLWKSGRTFTVEPPREASDSQEIKDYYTIINARISEQMEHEKAGFGTARLEAMTEEVGFGTGAIGVFSSSESDHKLEFKAMELKNLYISENALGRVTRVFYLSKLTGPQLQAEYGDSATRFERVKSLVDNDDHDTRLDVLWVIQPRQVKGVFGTSAYPYESIHILVAEKEVLRESGFNGMPVIVSRMYKNEGEEYGRGMGLNALPPTVELNAAIEIVTKGGELAAFPAIWTLDDGTFGNGTIDRSPMSVNPIDITSSRITGAAPMGQIGSVGDLNPLAKLIEFLQAEILAHFLNDKLTDLNNQTRMTLGEAQIRNELRADLTGSIFSRQIEEKYRPLIRRSVFVLGETGVLGVEAGSLEQQWAEIVGENYLVVPSELVDLRKQGVEIFNIKFNSPAARILRSEELRGVISLCQFAAGFSPVFPKFQVMLNDEKILESVRDLYGVSLSFIRDKETYDQLWAEILQSHQVMSQIDSAEKAADIQAKQASAQQMTAQADATRAGAGNAGGGGDYFSSMIL